MNGTRYAFFALLLICSVPAFPQTEAAVPGGIRLLPGYVHHRLQGIDSTVGKIVRSDGIEIDYDIGKMAGVYTNCNSCGWTEGELWRRKQIVNGHRVVIVYTRAHRIVASFEDAKANFYATVASEADISDFLLMVLTYRSP